MAVSALAALKARNPKARPETLIPDVHPARIPRHIAFIMDGNGRWARARGLPRELGHQQGAKTVRAVVEACDDIGVEVITLYSFSLENWKRPKAEVDALMQLCIAYLESEEEDLRRNGIRFRVIGRREGLPRPVIDAIDRVTERTALGTRGDLCLAINYSGRAELTDAAKWLAREVAAGRLSPEQIDESKVAGCLYTAGLPDPDLLIRTAGEKRISNYLLWQISYAELHITDVLWPDFGVRELHDAVRDYAARVRRFGAVEEAARVPQPAHHGADHAGVLRGGVLPR
ncbi:MAG TPA: polyprenyl diphosphate synthase [Phycisphaerales bacterium]|nr:polyprenyl diphosphate synthase [Phycisphaerales bacterium]